MIKCESWKENMFYESDSQTFKGTSAHWLDNNRHQQKNVGTLNKHLNSIQFLFMKMNPVVTLAFQKGLGIYLAYL